MSILFTLLALLLAIVAGGVLISNLFYWYEAANRRPELMESRFSGHQLLFALRLLATETLLVLFTLLLHPFGWAAPRREDGRQRRVDPRGAPPVLLLHGLFNNRACWLWTRHHLRRHGVPAVFSINLPLWDREVGAATARVARKIDELRIALGVEKVNVIGHSMGGLVALDFLQNGGAEKVDTCVLLGTPYHGSRLATLAISPLGKNLVPGSPFLTALAASGPPSGVRITAIFSRHDNLILPPENARVEGVCNIELEGVQHTGLLYHPLVMKSLIAELTENR